MVNVKKQIYNQFKHPNIMTSWPKHHNNITMNMTSQWHDILTSKLLILFWELAFNVQNLEKIKFEKMNQIFIEKFGKKRCSGDPSSKHPESGITVNWISCHSVFKRQNHSKCKLFNNLNGLPLYVVNKNHPLRAKLIVTVIISPDHFNTKHV